MPTGIDPADIHAMFNESAYEERFYMATQQEDARLWGWGVFLPVRGAEQWVKKWGEAVINDVPYPVRSSTAGLAGWDASIITETDRETRRVQMAAKTHHEVWDALYQQIHELQDTLNDPTLAQTIVAAFNRERDDTWLAAFIADVDIYLPATPATPGNPLSPGTALRQIEFGEELDGSTALNPTGTTANMTVLAAEGASTTGYGMIPAKVIEARACLDAFDAPKERSMAMSAVQYGQLSNAEQASSGDYGAKRLDTGEMIGMSGFKFILSNRIPAPPVAATDGDSTAVFGTDRCMRVGDTGMETKFGQDMQFDHRWQLSHYDRIQALRQYEEEAGRIWTTDDDAVPA